MRMMSIASGSTGNATYVGTDNTHILIDCGVSKKKIIDGLKKLDLTIDDIDCILLSHEHSDHIKSLDIFEKTHPAAVYCSQGTADALKASGKISFDHDLIHCIKDRKTFYVGDILIDPVKISHDAREPLCYRLDHNDKSCAVVTDLGCYDEELISRLQNLSALIIESNHNENMLLAGKYPYYLKRRILSDLGHLSNESCAHLLSELLHDNIKHVALGHLSRENNTEELACLTVKQEIGLSDTKYKEDDFKINLATYYAGSDIFCF